MTSQQEAMLNKIALNKNNLVNGKEPKTHQEASVYKDYIIESPIDRAVIGALFRFKWVEQFTDEDGDEIIQLTEDGFEQFIEL